MLGQTQLIHMFDVEDPMCVLKWIQGLVLVDKPGFKIRFFFFYHECSWSSEFVLSHLRAKALLQQFISQFHHVFMSNHVCLHLKMFYYDEIDIKLV